MDKGDPVNKLLDEKNYCCNVSQEHAENIPLQLPIIVLYLSINMLPIVYNGIHNLNIQ